MADKLRAIRWKGNMGPDNDRKGVLHIDRPDDHKRPRRVVQPGELIKDPANLAVLGADRIQELVDEGSAEYLDVLEKLGIGEVDKITTDSSAQEVENASAAASDAAKENLGKQALAARQIETGQARTDSRITGETLGAAGARIPASADLLGGGAAGPTA